MKDSIRTKILESEKKLEPSKYRDIFMKELLDLYSGSCAIISFQDFEDLCDAENLRIKESERQPSQEFLNNFKYSHILNARFLGKQEGEFYETYFYQDQTLNWDYRTIQDRFGCRLGFLHKKVDKLKVIKGYRNNDWNVRRAQDYLEQSFNKYTPYYYQTPWQDTFYTEAINIGGVTCQYTTIRMIGFDLNIYLRGLSYGSQFEYTFKRERISKFQIFKAGEEFEFQTCPFGIIIYDAKKERKFGFLEKIYYDHSAINPYG